MTATPGLSTSSGTTDAQGTSRTVAVPGDAAAGKVALLMLEMWESTATNPTVTWPSGFVEIANYVSTTDGFQKVKVARKVLTGTDSGTYAMSWSTTHWNQAQCEMWDGIDNTTPLDVAVNLAQNSSGTAFPSNALTTANAGDGIVYVVANENSCTQTPPTGYIEPTNGEANYLKHSYKVAGAAGSESISGGSVSASTLKLGVMIALRAAAGGGGNNTATSPATETDTGVAVGRTRSTAVGTATETDAGQAVARTRATATAPAAETDTGQAVTRTRSSTTAPAAETDTGQAIGRTRATPVGAAAETDTGVAITVPGGTTVTPAAELDQGVAVGRTRATGAAPASEIDTGVAVARTRSSTLAPAAELDTGQPIGRTRATPVLPALEADAGVPLFVPASDLLLSAYVEPDRLTGSVESQWHSEVEPDRLLAEVQR